MLQLVLSASRKSDWQDSVAGLTARDLAMNVALPELDGRILSRAVGFKKPPQRHPLTHAMTTAMRHRANVPAMWQAGSGWAAASHRTAGDKRIALIMANYPNRDGRLANGVGLDTPQSVMQTILALADAGYDVEDAPSNGAALVDDLRAGPTNEGWQGRVCDAIMPMEAYQDISAACRPICVTR